MTLPESDYMDEVRKVWHQRAAALKLKPGAVKYESQIAAYLQGVLAVATATGIMTMERASVLGFLLAAGRIDSFMKVVDYQPKGNRHE